MKIITMTFKGGTATIATEGFSGSDCQKETAEIEALLGDKISDTPTAEAGRKSRTARAESVKIGR